METNKTDKIVRAIFLLIGLGIGALVFGTAGTILYYVIKYTFFS